MKILVTGAAGFIGFHATQALIERGHDVLGIDNLNDYYSTQLKKDRVERLTQRRKFEFQTIDIADWDALYAKVSSFNPQRILHLAAQAGVRYSLINPDVYMSSNLVGFKNILELSRQLEIENTVYASSSSVYGCNTKIPFSELDTTDDPASLYGATKKSNELLAQAYARLHHISLTGLRFFTVYGPWGRPDMAYWMFAERILKGEAIRIFNNGDMSRDFTYIDDIVAGILTAIDRPASQLNIPAPHRIYNLGNDSPETLMDLVGLTESAFDRKSEKIMEPMQKGDVQRTWADISRAREELDYAPTITLADGLDRFASWYRPNWKRYLG